MTAKRTSLLVLGFGLLLLGLHAGDAVEGNDFGAYYAAGRAVLEGESIYSVASDEGRMYKYPPALAILIAPLSALPESVAAVIWVAAAVSLTFLSAFLCGRIAGHALGVKRTGLVAAASFLCVARPIDSDLGNGQANYLVLFFIAHERP
ncbi:MAG: glycosyltransferase 87 family protein, partial [Myxococcota bacterium]